MKVSSSHRSVQQIKECRSHPLSKLHVDMQAYIILKIQYHQTDSEAMEIIFKCHLVLPTIAT